MKKALLTGLVFILVILNSCENTQSDTPEIVELQINHYQTVANGPFPGLYYLTQLNEKIGGENWSIQYSPILNFEYEWGYTYDILAEKRDYQEGDGEPMMDTPSHKYIFIKELSKEKANADTQFEITLQRIYDDGTVESFLKGDKENGFKILDSKPFDCADRCDELTKERSPNTYLTGIFKHTEDGVIKLVGLKNQDMTYLP